MIQSGQLNLSRPGGAIGAALHEKRYAMNAFLKKLGFSPSDRVAIVHADDIGAYQASLPAIDDLFEAGLVSSCATMVPCSWFPAVAEWARRTPAADIGVHATLTAEYLHYRWGPISTRDPASGLLDDEGYFHRTRQAVTDAADPAAVAAEHQAQLDRALAAGIDVTHIDSHMGASFSPAFLPGYLAAGAAGRVPNFVLRLSSSAAEGDAIADEWSEQGNALMHYLEAQGLPLKEFDATLHSYRCQGHLYRSVI
jgi:predicted glycoside hydrolase/deacetylase ChbG (UPF0249 family)